MYLPSNYVTPQLYADPNGGALVVPPNGWQPAPAPVKRGMGLFDSADWTTWGWAEWLTLAAGAYFLWNLMGDIGKGATRVKRAHRKRKSRKAKREKLQEELSLI